MMMRCILRRICLVFIHAALPLDLLSLRGHFVYFDFWASWCTPCRQSFPWMQTLKNTYEAQDLTIVVVNMDTDRADADGFLEQFIQTFDVRFDPNGFWYVGRFAERYNEMYAESPMKPCAAYRPGESRESSANNRLS